MSLELSILTIEVGSTITKVNGFNRLQEGGFQHLAQGFAPTSISDGDVGIGVDQAVEDLKTRYKGRIDQPEVFVNSSAAGGLRMTVHGLTYSMTARAAREAALGAGGIVKLVTAGELDEYELEEIRDIHPNIILLAGGVDYGEKEVVLRNAEKLAALKLSVPVLFAGNSAIRKPIQRIFDQAGIETMLVSNVFPDVDVLNIEPVRKVIHELFNKHIIHAPGMSRLSELTHWGILPTPGAVLKAAELFADELGDCLIFDVGGATTDVHSVTHGSLEWNSRLIEPEPYAKRTVEGDLGVFVNAHNIMEMENDPIWNENSIELSPIPTTEKQKNLTRWLCSRAVETAVRRHAGVISDLYTPSGKKQIVKGKDLTAIQWVIGTGGALTLVDGGEEILRNVCTGVGKYLLPKPETKIILDREYRFSALGTLAQAYPEDVKLTFQNWVNSINSEKLEKFSER
ncbi:MAG: glutamate mutase L [Anaerolineaceae bacterium]|nr:glutamate mutase L [Anaerolineaceae bacterium]